MAEHSAMLSLAFSPAKNGKAFIQRLANINFINGDKQAVPFEALEGELLEVLAGEEDPTFSIYSDETVPVKNIVALMNIGKRNHYKVILATSPE